MSQNIAALLSHVVGPAPFTILDFGCGPGRDLKTFADLGHVAIGLDGAERFAEMARAVKVGAGVSVDVPGVTTTKAALKIEFTAGFGAYVGLAGIHDPMAKHLRATDQSMRIEGQADPDETR